MSRGMVSFLAGMGTGYIKAKDKALEQERQAKIDARADWEHNQKVDAANKQAKVDQDLIDAAAPRQAVSGEVIEAGGQKLFSADPGQAAQVKSMVDSIAELEGAAPAVQQPGYAVTGSMARGHQIGAGAAPDVAALNTPDAESQRVQDVYRRAGMRDKAMAEFTANENYKKALEERKTKMETEGVTTALGLLRAGAPEQAMEAFQKSGSIKLPEGSRFVQVDGTDMWTGKPGKIWAIQGSDGKTIVADVGQSVAKYLGIEGLLKLDGQVAKTNQEERKLEIQERLAAAREKQVDALAIKLAGGGSDGGAGGTRRSGASPVGGGLPDPMSGFDSKKAYAAAVEQATSELSQSGAPASPQSIAERATAIYRALESDFQTTGIKNIAVEAFSRSARAAKSPQEVQALYQKGLLLGMDPKEMAAIDPRFAPVEQSPQQKAVPATSGPMTNYAGKKTGTAQQKQQAIQPNGRVEYTQMQDAMKLGFQPAGRGNSLFGGGEILYINPTTGERKYASQLFGK